MEKLSIISIVLSATSLIISSTYYFIFLKPPKISISPIEEMRAWWIKSQKTNTNPLSVLIRIAIFNSHPLKPIFISQIILKVKPHKSRTYGDAYCYGTAPLEKEVKYLNGWEIKKIQYPIVVEPHNSLSGIFLFFLIDENNS